MEDIDAFKRRAKYLGIILNYKLAWNSQMQHIINKSRIALMAIKNA